MCNTCCKSLLFHQFCSAAVGLKTNASQVSVIVMLKQIWQEQQTCKVSQCLPLTISPTDGQFLHPCIVSFRGSATPFWSSNRVRRCSITSNCPLTSEAPPWALSVSTDSSAFLSSCNPSKVHRSPDCGVRESEQCIHCASIRWSWAIPTLRLIC